MKISTLLFIGAIAAPVVSLAQTPVVPDTVRQSRFEQFLDHAGETILLTVTPYEKLKGLQLGRAVVSRDSFTLARALKFSHPSGEGPRLINFRPFAFLDQDEVPDLLRFLETALALVQKRDPVERITRTLSYNSRGGVYAGCYQYGMVWRLRISTQPNRAFSYVQLNQKKTKELIDMLEHSMQDPVREPVIRYVTAP